MMEAAVISTPSVRSGWARAVKKTAGPKKIMRIDLCGVQPASPSCVTQPQCATTKGKTMSKHGNGFHENAGPCNGDYGQRWAGFLRQRYTGTCAAKRIARDFECEPRTATAWLGGQPPHIRHLARAGQVFGPVAIAAVLFPDTTYFLSADMHDAIGVLQARIDDIKNKLGALDEDFKNMDKPRD